MFPLRYNCTTIYSLLSIQNIIALVMLTPILSLGYFPALELQCRDQEVTYYCQHFQPISCHWRRLFEIEAGEGGRDDGTIIRRLC